MKLHRLQWLIPIVFAALALAGCGPGTDEVLMFSVDKKYAGRVGKPAGSVKFVALDGRKVDLDQLRGKVVLLDFWATWCGPCMRELPHVREVYRELHPRGFEIVGISFDQDRGSLEAIVRQEGITWPQSFEAGGDNHFGHQFGIDHYPSMWLVDQKGIVRFISAGADLKGKVLKLMAESPTTPSNDAPVAAPAPPKPAGAEQLRLTGIAGTAANRLVLVQVGAKTFTFGAGDEQVVTTAKGTLKLRCLAVETKTARFAVGDAGYEMELKAY